MHADTVTCLGASHCKSTLACIFQDPSKIFLGPRGCWMFCLGGGLRSLIHSQQKLKHNANIVTWSLVSREKYSGFPDGISPAGDESWFCSKVKIEYLEVQDT